MLSCRLIFFFVASWGGLQFKLISEAINIWRYIIRRQQQQPKGSQLLLRQESLANAKVSVRQQCVYYMKAPSEKSMANQRKQHNVDKYILCVTFTTLSLTMRGYIFIRLSVVVSQIYEIQRNSQKIRTYSSSRSSKVIDLVANWKRICNFLLVINSNFVRISYTVFEILTHFARKQLVVHTSPLSDAP